MVAVLPVPHESIASPRAEELTLVSELRVLVLETESSSALIHDLPALSGSRPRIEKVSGADAFREALAEFRPDAVIAGLSADGFGAAAALPLVRAELPGTPLVIVAASITDQAGAECARQADGVVLDGDRDTLAAVVESAVKLRRPLRKLSPRQLEVLRMVADGRSTREIGEILGLSMKTVESHRGAVMKRLARHNVADLVRYAVRTGVVTD
jgi:DNA-binding NarL/FixJ family response regulator